MGQSRVIVNESASVPPENRVDSDVIHQSSAQDKAIEEHVLPMAIRHLTCILLVVNLVLQPTQSPLNLNTNHPMTLDTPLLLFVVLLLPHNSRLSLGSHPLGPQYRPNIGSVQAVLHLHTMADIHHPSLGTLDRTRLRLISHRRPKLTSTITINNSRLSIAVMTPAMMSLLRFLTIELLILQLIKLRLIDRGRLHQ